MLNARDCYSLELSFSLHSGFNREEVDFPGFVDRIYYDAPQELFLINGIGETISISNRKLVLPLTFFTRFSFYAWWSSCLHRFMMYVAGPMQFSGIPI